MKKFFSTIYKLNLFILGVLVSNVNAADITDLQKELSILRGADKSSACTDQLNKKIASFRYYLMADGLIRLAETKVPGAGVLDHLYFETIFAGQRKVEIDKLKVKKRELSDELKEIFESASCKNELGLRKIAELRKRAAEIMAEFRKGVIKELAGSSLRNVLSIEKGATEVVKAAGGFDEITGRLGPKSIPGVRVIFKDGHSEFDSGDGFTLIRGYVPYGELDENGQTKSIIELDDVNKECPLAYEKEDKFCKLMAYSPNKIGDKNVAGRDVVIEVGVDQTRTILSASRGGSGTPPVSRLFQSNYRIDKVNGKQLFYYTTDNDPEVYIGDQRYSLQQDEILNVIIANGYSTDLIEQAAVFKEKEINELKDKAQPKLRIIDQGIIYKAGELTLRRVKQPLMAANIVSIDKALIKDDKSKFAFINDDAEYSFALPKVYRERAVKLIELLKDESDLFGNKKIKSIDAIMVINQAKLRLDVTMSDDTKKIFVTEVPRLSEAEFQDSENLNPDNFKDGEYKQHIFIVEEKENEAPKPWGMISYGTKDFKDFNARDDRLIESATQTSTKFKAVYAVRKKSSGAPWQIILAGEEKPGLLRRAGSGLYYVGDSVLSFAVDWIFKPLNVVFSPAQSYFYTWNWVGTNLRRVLPDKSDWGFNLDAQIDSFYTYKQIKFIDWTNKIYYDSASALFSESSVKTIVGVYQELLESKTEDVRRQINDYMDALIINERVDQYGEMLFNLMYNPSDMPISEQERAFMAAQKFGFANVPHSAFVAAKKGFVSGNIGSGIGYGVVGITAIAAEAYAVSLGLNAIGSGVVAIRSGVGIANINAFVRVLPMFRNVENLKKLTEAVNAGKSVYGISKGNIELVTRWARYTQYPLSAFEKSKLANWAGGLKWMPNAAKTGGAFVIQQDPMHMMFVANLANDSQKVIADMIGSALNKEWDDRLGDSVERWVANNANFGTMVLAYKNFGYVKSKLPIVGGGPQAVAEKILNHPSAQKVEKSGIAERADVNPTPKTDLDKVREIAEKQLSNIKDEQNKDASLPSKPFISRVFSGIGGWFKRTPKTTPEVESNSKVTRESGSSEKSSGVWAKFGKFLTETVITRIVRPLEMTESRQELLLSIQAALENRQAVLLTGPSKAGKTALMKLLAKAILAKDKNAVIKAFEKAEILELDLKPSADPKDANTDIGSVKQKLIAAIAEAKKSKTPLILFIEEMQYLLSGKDDKLSNHESISKVLADAIEQSQTEKESPLYIVGEVPDSLRETVQKDSNFKPSLFHTQEVKPFTVDEKKLILALHAETLEKKHGVTIPVKLREVILKIAAQVRNAEADLDTAITMLDSASARKAAEATLNSPETIKLALEKRGNEMQLTVLKRSRTEIERGIEETKVSIKEALDKSDAEETGIKTRKEITFDASARAKELADSQAKFERILRQLTEAAESKKKSLGEINEKIKKLEERTIEVAKGLDSDKTEYAKRALETRKLVTEKEKEIELANKKLQELIVQRDRAITKEEKEKLNYEVLALKEITLRELNIELENLKDRLPDENGKPKEVILTVKDFRDFIPQEISREKLVKLIARMDTIIDDLGLRVIGQEEAMVRVEAVLVQAYRKYFTWMLQKIDNPDTAPEAPPVKGILASYLVAGGPGLGKTFHAKEFAKLLFPKDQFPEMWTDPEGPVVLINCVELTDEQTIKNELLGATAGFVRSDESTSQLAGPIKKNRFRIVIWDELEKAGPALVNFLLTPMNEGKVKDNKGTMLDLSGTSFIFTTNAGAGVVDKYIDPVTHKITDLNGYMSQLSKAVTAQFKEKGLMPFLSRNPTILPFKPLAANQIKTILGFELKKLNELHKANNNSVELTPRTLDAVLAVSDLDYGARNPISFLGEMIDGPLGKKLSQLAKESGDVVIRNSRIVVDLPPLSKKGKIYVIDKNAENKPPKEVEFEIPFEINNELLAKKAKAEAEAKMAREKLDREDPNRIITIAFSKNAPKKTVLGNVELPKLVEGSKNLQTAVRMMIGNNLEKADQSIHEFFKEPSNKDNQANKENLESIRDAVIEMAQNPENIKAHKAAILKELGISTDPAKAIRAQAKENKDRSVVYLQDAEGNKVLIPLFHSNPNSSKIAESILRYSRVEPSANLLGVGTSAFQAFSIFEKSPIGVRRAVIDVGSLAKDSIRTVLGIDIVSANGLSDAAMKQDIAHKDNYSTVVVDHPTAGLGSVAEFNTYLENGGLMILKTKSKIEVDKLPSDYRVIEETVTSDGKEFLTTLRKGEYSSDNK